MNPPPKKKTALEDSFWNVTYSEFLRPSFNLQHLKTERHTKSLDCCSHIGLNWPHSSTIPFVFEFFFFSPWDSLRMFPFPSILIFRKVLDIVHVIMISFMCYLFLLFPFIFFFPYHVFLPSSFHLSIHPSVHTVLVRRVEKCSFSFEDSVFLAIKRYLYFLCVRRTENSITKRLPRLWNVCI